MSNIPYFLKYRVRVGHRFESCPQKIANGWFSGSGEQGCRPGWL